MPRTGREARGVKTLTALKVTDWLQIGYGFGNGFGYRLATDLATDWLRIGYGLGYGLTTDRVRDQLRIKIRTDYGLATDWLWIGYGLTTNWLLFGYGLAIVIVATVKSIHKMVDIK